MPGAPLPENEIARLRALQQCRILDTAPESAFDDIAKLAAFICQTPIALVSLVDAERQWFKARVGLTITETDRTLAFCSYTILQNDVLIVPDALSDPRFTDNPLVRSKPFIRFYAGIPLITVDGLPLGSLCVIDYVPRTLNPQQIQALKTLSQQVIKQLELRRYSAELERDSITRKRLWSNDKKLQGVKVGFGLALSLFFGMGTLIYQQVTGLSQSAQLTIQTQSTLTHLQHVLADVQATELSQQRFVSFGQEQDLQSYYTAIAHLHLELQILKSQAQYNFEQQQWLDRLQQRLAWAVAETKGVIIWRQQHTAAPTSIPLTANPFQELEREVRDRINQIETIYLTEPYLGQVNIDTQPVVIKLASLLVFSFIALAIIFYFTLQILKQRQQI
jgi:CHASE3 domain sensor protein